MTSVATTRWVSRLRWDNLLFAHWPIEATVMAQHVPEATGLELDLFEGHAWLGIVPFQMVDVRLRGLPALPTMRSFPEINVRTYVRHRGAVGVVFLSLDAASRLMVGLGRVAFHVPYHHADMELFVDGDAVALTSSRLDASGPARFAATYRPIGHVRPAAAGSFDAWSTDRMTVFAVDRSSTLWRTDIDHAPWRLQAAEAQLDARGLAAAVAIELPDVEPRLAFSSRITVRGGLPRRVSGGR